MAKKKKPIKKVEKWCIFCLEDCEVSAKASICPSCGALNALSMSREIASGVIEAATGGKMPKEEDDVLF